MWNRWEFETGYLHMTSHFSNPDRNGFLQNACRLPMITPVTFGG